MNKSVETTVVIELFSTFFEKLTLNHKYKMELNHHLSDLKSVLYSSVLLLKYFIYYF
jgi:hypothetical protein